MRSSLCLSFKGYYALQSTARAPLPVNDLRLLFSVCLFYAPLSAASDLPFVPAMIGYYVGALALAMHGD